MTDFSLNIEFENLIKVTLADQEQQKQQQQTEEIAMGQQKKHEESAKIPDLFQNNSDIKKKFFSYPYTTTRIKLQNIFIKYFINWYQ